MKSSVFALSFTLWFRGAIEAVINIDERLRLN